MTIQDNSFITDADLCKPVILEDLLFRIRDNGSAGYDHSNSHPYNYWLGVLGCLKNIVNQGLISEDQAIYLGEIISNPDIDVAEKFKQAPINNTGIGFLIRLSGCSFVELIQKYYGTRTKYVPTTPIKPRKEVSKYDFPHMKNSNDKLNNELTESFENIYNVSNRSEDFKRFFRALFDENSYINLDFENCSHFNEGFTVKQIIDNADEYINKYSRFKVNCMNSGSGSGKIGAYCDCDVSKFKYVMIECDDIPLREQFNKLSTINLPIVAVVYSGGKSIQFVLDVSAQDKSQYDDLVSRLYDNLINSRKIPIDPQNKNCSRYMRLPGAKRIVPKGKKNLLKSDKVLEYEEETIQTLMYLGHTGAKNVSEWLETEENSMSIGSIINEVFKYEDKGQIKYKKSDDEVRISAKKFFQDKIIKSNEDLYLYDENLGIYELVDEEKILNIYLGNFYNPVADQIENFRIPLMTIKRGITKFCKDTKIFRENSEFNPPHLVHFTNGIYDINKKKLLPFSKEFYLTRKHNFKFLEDVSVEELEHQVREVYNDLWSKSINDWNAFSSVFWLHLINFKYYRLRILLHIVGISKSGKSTFNDFINKFTNENYVAELKFKENNSFNFNSIKPITQIFQFADTRNSGNFLEDLKQLNGESRIVWEGKYQSQRTISNNGLIKFVSNEGEGYPAVLKHNWFYDKIVKIEFLATYSDVEKDLLEQKYGDKDKMFEKLKDVFATYFIRTCNKFFEKPVKFLTNSNLKKDDPNEFYCKLFLKMISNKQFITLKRLGEKIEGTELSKLSKFFKKYCEVKNKNVDEINTKNLGAILKKSGNFNFIYFKSRIDQIGQYRISFRGNLITMTHDAYQNLNKIRNLIRETAEFEELDDRRIDELFGEFDEQINNEAIIEQSAEGGLQGNQMKDVNNNLSINTEELFKSEQLNNEDVIKDTSGIKNKDKNDLTNFDTKLKIYLKKIDNLITKYPDKSLFKDIKKKLESEDTDDDYLEFCFLEIDKHN